MASIRKRGKTWTAEVRMRGVRQSATFATKAEAAEWAAEIERKARRGEASSLTRRTVADVFDRYAEIVSPQKRGAAWEARRLLFYGRDEIAKVRLSDLTAKDWAEFRDRRLQEVSAATLNRDFHLLSHAFTVARKEWGWVTENALSDVRRPKEAGPRQRRLMAGELEALRIATGYRPDKVPQTAQARVQAAFEFALETALRSGEIVALRRPDVAQGHVHVAFSKTDRPRDVPLSVRAREIVGQVLPLGLDPLFGLTARQRDALWRKGRERAGIAGLNFHDSRREALTRMARKYGVLELAAISGHADIGTLRTVYYAPTVEELAEKIG